MLFLLQKQRLTHFFFEQKQKDKFNEKKLTKMNWDTQKENAVFV